MFSPEFFDIFGSFAFLFIVIASLCGLVRQGYLPKWVLFMLLVIGITGLVVDVSIVYFSYIRGGL
jgi:uncharacterized membrane protein